MCAGTIKLSSSPFDFLVTLLYLPSGLPASCFHSLLSRNSSCGHRCASSFLGVSRSSAKLGQGATSPIRDRDSFNSNPRPRDRTPRTARRLDINARATPRTRSPCLLAAAALGASAPTTTSSPRALVLVRTTTPLAVSSNFSFRYQSGCPPRTRRQCAPMRLVPTASRGILSNSPFASGFGSNTGNAFGSNNNTTGGGMFGGNTTSTFGSGGTCLLCALRSRSFCSSRCYACEDTPWHILHALSLA